jgi:hypothetical protein
VVKVFQAELGGIVGFLDWLFGNDSEEEKGYKTWEAKDGTKIHQATEGRKVFEHPGRPLSIGHPPEHPSYKKGNKKK